MTEPTTATNGSGTSATATVQPNAAWYRPLLIALGLVSVGAVGVYWWAFEGGENWWRSALLPSQAAFRGKVTLDGEPLRGGQLMTWPVRAGVPRSVGFIEQNGEFILRTDINGRYTDTAFVGRHRVTVEQFAMQVGASPPRMTSPEKYANPAMSGLEITVDRDPSKNEALVVLLSDTQQPHQQQSDSKAKSSNQKSRQPPTKSDSNDSMGSKSSSKQDR